MGRSPLSYLQSFVEIGLQVPEKIFGHVTSIMLTNFISVYLKAFIQNLVQNGTVVSEKIWFEFLYVHYLGPRSRNYLDLQYPHTFMKSVSCLNLPFFRSQASIDSEKSTVFTFSYKVSKFDLAVK